MTGSKIRAAVYVPSPGSHLAGVVLRGSGIVGVPFEGRTMVDYEGNRYGAVNLQRYADRVRQADGRQQQSYPTVARMVVPNEDVVQVAVFDRWEGVVIVGDPVTLAEWIGVELPIDEWELECTR